MKKSIKILLAMHPVTESYKTMSTSNSGLSGSKLPWQRIWQRKSEHQVKSRVLHYQEKIIAGNLTRKNIGLACLESLYSKGCSIFMSLPACQVHYQKKVRKTAVSALPDFLYIIYMYGYVFHRNIPISATKTNPASKNFNKKRGTV